MRGYVEQYMSRLISIKNADECSLSAAEIGNMLNGTPRFAHYAMNDSDYLFENLQSDSTDSRLLSAILMYPRLIRFYPNP